MILSSGEFQESLPDDGEGVVLEDDIPDGMYHLVVGGNIHESIGDIGIIIITHWVIEISRTQDNGSETLKTTPLTSSRTV